MAFLVLLIPLAVMAFALLMERLERRLQTSTMSEQDVQEFLDQAEPDEVNTFIREGWTRALSKFRLRSRRNRPSRRVRRLATGRSSGSETSPAARPSGPATARPAGPGPAQSDATPRSAHHEQPHKP